MELVPEGLKQPKSARGVKHLPQHARRQSIVQAHPAGFADHGAKVEGLALHAGQIPPDGQGVGRVDDHPAQASAEAGSAEHHALGEGGVGWFPRHGGCWSCSCGG